MVFQIIISKKAILKIIAFFLISYSCIDNRQALTNIHSAEGPFSSFNAEAQITDTLNLDLSNFFEDMWIVKLEMTPKSIVGEVHNIVFGNGYILVITERDFFLFSDSGSFLGKPFTYGRGPDEVIAPCFSPEIRDSMIIFCDGSTPGSIFYYNLQNRTMNRVRVHGGGQISRVIAESDTTLFLIITSVSGVERFIVEYECNLKRISSEGVVLDSFKLGSTESFVQTSPSIIKDLSGECFVSSPRGDSVMRFNGNSLEIVWRNLLSPYKPNLNELMKIGTVQTIALGNEIVLLIRAGVEVSGEGIIWGRPGSPGKSTIRSIRPEIIEVNRLTGEANVIKLFLENGMNAITPGKLIILPEGRVCISIKPSELLAYNNSRRDNSESQIFGNKSKKEINNIISENDNPYLIFATIKSR